ncbi:MAG TPA: hypothetical protein VM432_08040 [Bdellovibrionales bacterium]|nr:hypothetical protein [Bdellovibrionales bacterium]
MPNRLRIRHVQKVLQTGVLVAIAAMTLSISPPAQAENLCRVVLSKASEFAFGQKPRVFADHEVLPQRLPGTKNEALFNDWSSIAAANRKYIESSMQKKKVDTEVTRAERADLISEVFASEAEGLYRQLGLVKTQLRQARLRYVKTSREIGAIPGQKQHFVELEKELRLEQMMISLEKEIKEAIATRQLNYAKFWMLSFQAAEMAYPITRFEELQRRFPNLQSDLDKITFWHGTETSVVWEEVNTFKHYRRLMSRLNERLRSGHLPIPSIGETDLADFNQIAHLRVTVLGLDFSDDITFDGVPGNSVTFVEHDADHSVELERDRTREMIALSFDKLDPATPENILALHDFWFDRWHEQNLALSPKTILERWRKQTPTGAIDRAVKAGAEGALKQR